ncbi:MAG: acetyl/propionyl/methylcrotonyl-CoA carboxylase subunit alpha [Acidimicrobiales bacterium]
MFDTVLVANRGEIAVRVIRTLRRLGIRSVAVYSDADRSARHVLEADEAFYIGATPALESYLNIERVLDACARSSAQALHPGYGFLAENPLFAEACTANGVVFIGPSADAIRLMGDKIQAKLHVAASGVPVVPGRVEAGMSDDDLVRAAEEIGFPVLVKPSAGGGGKGMQFVEHESDLKNALVSARREATAAFGDDSLFIERFVERPRHIEVQVLADRHGTTVHLGERECSLQRRHQKVVEESPSPLIDDATRDRLGAAAIAAAKSVDYYGVGTVEFIVATARPDEFFFMEMNTRLQVEHPVTEMVTDLDLVEQQLRVAAGEPLSNAVMSVKLRGHSVEARLYAENPARDFLPTSGRVLEVHEPVGDGIRVDSSLLEGLDVATDYDPMLAKVVAWGPDRTSAYARLGGALEETVVFGVVTNLGFLGRLVASPDVLAGDLDTGLIEREVDALVAREPSTEALALFALSWLERLTPTETLSDPWRALTGWRGNGRQSPAVLRVKTGTEDVRVIRVSGTPGEALVSVNDGDDVVAKLSREHGQSFITVNGAVHRAWYRIDGATTWVCVGGETWPFLEVDVTSRARGAAALSNDVRSPMPGTVVSVATEDGAEVHVGQALVVVSAMKMEHVLVAPRDGTVDILVREGDSVVVDQVVARLTPASTSTEPSS